ncbi:hypothetical protein [Pedobacter sp. MR2016-24]|uniref:hypothetical protein n=1 Tax=Pedobacter sp. MR2016-24 TaxID=2994466 RepID=UPI00224803F9|nr:hypothetical protein [Pedobacter sp. MR2016-24]MCX2483763.1 hypothetical protein [Pedobacter sp. MR2016-24]
MAKRRTKKTTAHQTGFKKAVISLGILFSVILFLIKIITGSMGWFEVFAPVLIAFFILFMLSVLRTVLRKI